MALKIGLAQKGLKLQRYSIELNGKLQFTQTVGQSPHGKNECDVLRFLSGRTGLPNTGILKPRIFESYPFWESIVSKSTDSVQMSLAFKPIPSAFDFLMKKIVIVDPAPELLVDRHVFQQQKYKQLPRCPHFIQSHIDFILSESQRSLKEREESHLDFWESVMRERKDKREMLRSDIGRLLNWANEVSSICKPDAYIPLAPHVKYRHRKKLLDIAFDVNEISQDIIEGEVIKFISVDAPVFRDSRLINKIAEYFDESKQQDIYAIKIQNPESLVDYTHGKIALKNLEHLLTTIKHIREVTVDGKRKVFGLLNGNSFGFCLLGLLDFFVADIGNYEYGWKPKERKTHRGCLHPESLKVEPWEYWEENRRNGEIPAVYHPDRKYVDINPTDFKINKIAPIEWRNDCKISGVNMWDTFTRELLGAMAKSNHLDSLIFDRIGNSAYANLVPLIRNVLEK